MAHGPSRDDENRRWLADMASLAARVGTMERFGSIDYLTLRDDAPKPIRDQATAELRALVAKRHQRRKEDLDRSAAGLVRRNRARPARAPRRAPLHDAQRGAGSRPAAGRVGAGSLRNSLTLPLRRSKGLTRSVVSLGP